ncbi:MAG: response regulator transcription factor [Salibacteraceae bacterium]
MIRVALADDHQLVLDGLKAIINEHPELEFVAEASDGMRMLEILKCVQVDVALVDIDMPRLNGLQVIEEVSRKALPVKCVALTMYNEKGMVQRVKTLGAFGYLLKNIDQDELTDAIVRVHRGERMFCVEPNNSISLTSRSSEIEFRNKSLNHTLTQREVEILRLIAEGYSNKEIGDRLYISHRTVDTHRTNLMKKLDIHNIAGLIRYAINTGILEA